MSGSVWKRECQCVGLNDWYSLGKRGRGGLKEESVSEGRTDNEAVWSAYFSAYRCGETIAHCAETSGGDHCAGTSPPEMLGAPHLMLADLMGSVLAECMSVVRAETAHARGYDGAVFHMCRHVTKLLDDRLRFDEFIWRSSVVIKW